MSRRLPARALALALSALPTARASTPEVPRFPGQVEQVTVDVVVLDSDGRPVTGLTAADFTVYEDGKAQPVESFEAVHVPEAASAAPPSRLLRPRVSTNLSPAGPPERSIVIVMDTVHLSHTQAERARAAVGDFIRTGLAGGDRVQLTATGGGAWWSGRMPGVGADLLAALEGLKGLRPMATGADHIWDYEAQAIYTRRDSRMRAQVMRRWVQNGLLPESCLDPDHPQASGGHALVQAKAMEAYKDAVNRQRVTTRALERVLQGLATSRGRKTVLLVTEGFVHDPQEGGFARVTDAARRANAVIYFMDARTPQGGESSSAELARALHVRDIGESLTRAQQDATGTISLAVDSGGERLGSAATLADNLRQVADLSRAYYLLGYHPANFAADGRFRKIKVEVARRGVAVRARRGYTVPREQDGSPREAVRLDPDVQHVLDSPFAARGIPLRLASYLLGPADSGKMRVMLVAEADIRGLSLRPEGGRHADILESFLVVTSRDTGANQSHQGQLDLNLPADVRAQLEKSWLPLQRPFDLAPGVYQARLALREKNGAALGSVAHEFEVEVEGPGRLRVTTPVITDALAAGAEGRPPQPSVIARRTFAPGSRLFVQFEVWGAGAGASTGKPPVTAAHVLRGPGGAVLARAEATPLGISPQGSLGRVFALDLPRAAAGEHELALTVRDEVSGETVEVLEPLLVQRP